MITGLTVLVALIMLVGIVGIVVPVLPGLLLVWASTVLWAAGDHRGGGAWVVAGIATALYAVGLILQFSIPGKRLKAAGVSTGTLVVAVLTAVVGSFAIPFVGAIPGFVLGIYVVELSRARDRAVAWRSTKHALGAVGLSMLIELLTSLAIMATWVVGVVTTAP